jgi:hypothetical protein
LKKAPGKFHKTVKKDDEKTVVAGEILLPGFGNFTYCSDMPTPYAKHVDPGNRIPETDSPATK